MGPLQPVQRESVEAFRARMEAKSARARELRAEEERAAQSQVTARHHLRPVAPVPAPRALGSVRDPAVEQAARQDLAARRLREREERARAREDARRVRDEALVAAYLADPTATTTTLGLMFGVTRECARTILAAAGVERRGRPRSDTAPPTRVPPAPKSAAQLRAAARSAAIVAAYVDDPSLSMVDVGARFGITGSRVSQVLRTAGVRERHTEPLHRRGVDVPQLVAAYEAGESVPMIAERLGHARSTVRRALRSAGVVMRDDRANNSGGHPKRATDDDPALAALVVDAYAQGASLEGVVAGVPGATSTKLVSNPLRRHGVQLRPPASTPYRLTPKLLDEMADWEQRGFSHHAIAQRFGFSQTYVSRKLRAHREGPAPLAHGDRVPVVAMAAPDPSPALPPAAPSAPAPLSTPPPAVPDPPAVPVPDELPAVADFNAALVGMVDDLLASTDRLEAAADLLDETRARLAHARRAATDLLALLPIPAHTQGVPDVP